MKFNIPKDWIMANADKEEGLNIEAGIPPDFLRIRLPNALPCPFCGSSRIVKGERYFALCVDCGATGPERNADASERKFTADWNTRKNLA